ncbi:MAG: DNA-3-methyladenine glycosylase I [Clostridiales bacterium]|jgi:DNA-3-methyladenine glycosylase I|nr:DNA-3-methyladenine glycosylase I [Clostridiales bacterium]
MSWYCDYIISLPEGEKKQLHKNYHDNHYGFPLHDDNELFGRLILEINQAGLSWETMLKKEQNFRKAYDNFDVAKIAEYGEEDRHRLLSDSGIIRNARKIDAAIYNAKITMQLGGFNNWIEKHRGLSKDEWVKLFKEHFHFVGGEIVGEFLMSIGVLDGAHSEACPIYKKIKELTK